MSRYVYGRDYKPPSKTPRNLLIAIAAAAAVITFVWKTYDPHTFRLINGLQPAAEKMQPAAAVPQFNLQR
jgi:hypothetical protein